MQCKLSHSSSQLLNSPQWIAWYTAFLSQKFSCSIQDSDSILLDYSATIFDVERIAGFQFSLGALSPQQNTILRRRITTSLW